MTTATAGAKLRPSQTKHVEVTTDENDYARTRVPDNAKRGAGSILSVLVGFVTAFYFPLVGGTYMLQNGAPAAWIALVISFAILMVLALIVTKAASREGLTSELLTRACGFGTVGSAFTSIIYAGTFVIYAGMEGQILSSAIDRVWDIPNQIWYVLVGVIFLPMAWNGISAMTKILTWTLPVYFILLIAAIISAWNGNGGMPDIFTAMPDGSVGGVAGVVAVMAGLAGTVGINPLEASDYNRFIHPKDFGKKAWLTVVLPYAFMFFIAFPLGFYFTLATGSKSSNPSIYFIGLIGLIPAVLLAWISQIRVNLTNLHIGSLTFASVSESVGANKLNRRFWLLIVTAGAIALMMFDVIGHLTVFLDWLGIFLLTWVACVVADITVVRGALKLVTGPYEYRTGVARKFNPVGIAGLFSGVIVASAIWILAPNPILHGLCSYIGFVVAFIVHSTVAILTKGRTYFIDPDDKRIGVNNK